MGPKGLRTPAYLLLGLRPMPKRKNCSRMNEGNLDYYDTLLRTTLSSANRNHKKGRRHMARGNPLEDPKKDLQPNKSAIEAW